MQTGPVHTDHAPAAVGPYSQGYWAGELFYSAGQVGLVPATGQLVGTDVVSQAERVMTNLAAVLDEAGLAFADIVKTTIFLADMGDFGAVNEIYARHFEPPYPARSTVAVGALPLGARVEIEVIARARPGA
ncbi:RidA family protein [Candidatus Palauibacter sp.]|uniref:RidA family protein n=1 Tax=Candidatus Palauibacter sp. TaxID=3101350 RepID=UPI003B51F2B4